MATRKKRGEPSGKEPDLDSEIEHLSAEIEALYDKRKELLAKRKQKLEQRLESKGKKPKARPPTKKAKAKAVRKKDGRRTIHGIALEWREYFREVFGALADSMRTMGYSASHRTYLYSDDSVTAQIDVDLGEQTEPEIIRDIVADLEELPFWKPGDYWVAAGVEIHGEGDSPALAGDVVLWTNYQRAVYLHEVFLALKGFDRDGIIGRLAESLGPRGYFARFMIRARFLPDLYSRPEPEKRKKR